MATRAVAQRPLVIQENGHICLDRALHNYTETPVRWIRDAEEHSTAAKVTVYILAVLCSIILCATLIGIHVVYKGWREYKFQSLEKEFLAEMMGTIDDADRQYLNSQPGVPLAAPQPAAEPPTRIVPGALTAAGIALRESRGAQNVQPAGAGVPRQASTEDREILAAYRASRLAEAQARAASGISIRPVMTQAERDADPFATVIERMAQEHEESHPGELDPMTTAIIGDGNGNDGCIQQ